MSANTKSGATRYHGWIRLMSLAALGGGLAFMAGQTRIRADLTQEGLSNISQETVDIMAAVQATQPVRVTAYVSREVPRAYVPTRTRLLNVLREMQAREGGALSVRIVEPEPFSEEAVEAAERYQIVARPLVSRDGGRTDTLPVFMGLAFESGPREQIIPFMERGLSVEYELARALDTVNQANKRVIGILRTDVKMMGDFDLQNRKQIPPWRIVKELRGQYSVQSVDPGGPVKKEVDVLLVPQISSMTQPQLDNLQAYLLEGRPALIIADPMPEIDVRLMPQEPMVLPPGKQQMGGGAQGTKGDYVAVLRAIGVDWLDTEVVYDREKPDPRFDRTTPFVVFSGDRPGDPAFAGGDPIVDGLSSVVSIFPGTIAAAKGAKGSFSPLLRTGPSTGRNPADELVRRHPFFGLRGPQSPRRLGAAASGAQVIAARVQGEGEGGVNTIVVADIDLLADSFFVMRERGGDVDGDGLVDERFDNVSFLLNCIDTLAGDARFVELRKRQPRFRRLDAMLDFTKAARTRRGERVEAAKKLVDDEMLSAQAALDAEVKAIMARDDVDEKTKQVMAKSARDVTQRRVDAKRTGLEREAQAEIDKIELEHRREVDEVHDRIRVAAVLLPPIPAILIGLMLYWRKRRREYSTIPAGRRASDTKAGA